MTTPRLLLGGLLGFVGASAIIAACGSGGGGTTGGSSGSAAVTAGGTGAPVTQPKGTATTQTLPQATTALLGLVVGGSGGEPGAASTDSLSEVVRNADGTCAGWAGRGVSGPWTSGVKQGAKVQLFDAAVGGRLLASGTLSAGTAQDVDPPKGQWQCTLKFSIAKLPNATKYYAQVDSLSRVEARPDPSTAGTYVVPVSTAAKASLIDACKDPHLPTAVSSWKSVGEYWSQGLPGVCSAGLRVNRLERVCRPKTIASDRVVAVVDALSGKVYEDTSGLKVDPASLKPGTVVTVRVSTAYPCA
jgi:hypothetical protein